MRKEFLLLLFVFIFVWVAVQNIAQPVQTKSRRSKHIAFAPIAMQRVFSKKSGEIIGPDIYVRVDAA